MHESGASLLPTSPLTWSDDQKSRFWAKVNVADDDACWEWNASLDKKGYGQFAERHGVMVKAHRTAYELLSGPITDGLFACHTCDNPRCCNPRHIFLGTNADNMRDCAAKGRAGARKNSKHETDARAVKILRTITGWGAVRISRALSMPFGSVQNILQSRCWRNA
jgi:hypothetical protein